MRHSVFSGMMLELVASDTVIRCAWKMLCSAMACAVIGLIGGCGDGYTTANESSNGSLHEFRARFTCKSADGEWRHGYVDHSGDIVIKPLYSDAVPFGDGMAVVRRDDGQWCVLNSEGRQIGILPTSGKEGLSFRTEGGLIIGRHLFEDWVMVYSPSGAKLLSQPYTSALVANGIALVSWQQSIAEDDPDAPTRRFGYVHLDRPGSTPKQAYLDATAFCGGVAAVYTKGGQWKVIDRNEKVVAHCTPGMDILSPFQDGLALVRDEKRDTYGFMGVDGKVAIPAEFSLASPFREGRSAVTKTSSSDYLAQGYALWGYIDREGRWAIPATYQDAKSFRGGLAYVTRCALTGQKGFIDRSGRQVIALDATVNYVGEEGFTSGLCPIDISPSDQEGVTVYIDRSGAIALRPPSAKDAYFDVLFYDID